MDTLPFDHPLVQSSLAAVSIAARESAVRLAAQGHPIRLVWIDPIPESSHGAGPTPGRVAADAYDQERDITRAVGTQSGTMFKTARTRTVHLGPEPAPGTGHATVLTLPVWRWGRRDLTCTPVCKPARDGLACADCGTGDYWLLPEYTIPPPWEPGLSHPEDRNRLRPDIEFLLALGSKPIKVRFTDHARYARGMTGRPEPDRVLRLMRVIVTSKGHTMVVKSRNGGESLVSPDQIRLVETPTADTGEAAPQER